MTGVWHTNALHAPFYSAEMALDTEALTAKIQELEQQVAALKKDNTRLKNEMRFNLDQEK